MIEDSSQFAPDEPQTLREIAERLPNSFDVEQNPSELTIVEHWFRWSHAVALLIVAAGALLVIQDLTFSWVGPQHEQIPAWGAVAMLAAAICVTYWAIAGCVNSTKLTVTDYTFSRDMGPLPWFGSFEVARDEVDQFFVRRHTTNVRRQSLWDWDGDHTTEGRGGFSLKYSKTVSRYRLTVQFKNGRRRGVSNKYGMPYAPRIVEAIIEAVLGIQDRFVQGEARRVHN